MLFVPALDNKATGQLQAVTQRHRTALATVPSSDPVGNPRMTLRLRIASWHLLGSVAAATCAWWLVFRLWYPPPFAELAGGAALFLLLVAVDVVIGPALTLVVANPRKRRSELLRDLTVILGLQLLAFGYGLNTMALVRPVAIVFEYDLWRVVAANDIDVKELAAAPAALRNLPWGGPRVLAVVKPQDPAEQLRIIELGLAGVPLAAMPAHWREFAEHAPMAWKAAKPVANLLTRQPTFLAQAEVVAKRAGVPLNELRVLPVMARRSEWVALMSAPGARIVGYLPLSADP